MTNIITFTDTVGVPEEYRPVPASRLVPAGTPIMQIIPIKRDEWQMEIGDKEEFEAQAKITNKLRTIFFDSYKKQYRQPKEYR